jgi:ribosome-binding protein aMBF1 (putative translation factor)
MITNERQYRITRAEAGRFEQALARAEEQGDGLHPRIRQAMRESLESQLRELREQLAEYEALRSGGVRVVELDSLDGLRDVLVLARTAAGLTQKELAARLGLKEQQIQRYEASRYAGVSLERIQAVTEALGLKVREQVTLPSSGEEAETKLSPVDDPAG